jgi:hypothetical protein
MLRACHLTAFHNNRALSFWTMSLPQASGRGCSAQNRAEGQNSKLQIAEFAMTSAILIPELSFLSNCSFSLRRG